MFLQFHIEVLRKTQLQRLLCPPKDRISLHLVPNHDPVTVPFKRTIALLHITKSQYSYPPLRLGMIALMPCATPTNYNKRALYVLNPCRHKNLSKTEPCFDLKYSGVNNRVIHPINFNIKNKTRRCVKARRHFPVAGSPAIIKSQTRSFMGPAIKS